MEEGGHATAQACASQQCQQGCTYLGNHFLLFSKCRQVHDLEETCQVIIEQTGRDSAEQHHGQWLP